MSDAEWRTYGRVLLMNVLQVKSSLADELDYALQHYESCGSGPEWYAFERYLRNGLAHRGISNIVKGSRTKVEDLRILTRQLIDKLNRVSHLTPDVILLFAHDILRSSETLDKVNAVLDGYEEWYKGTYLPKHGVSGTRTAPKEWDGRKPLPSRLEAKTTFLDILLEYRSHLKDALSAVGGTCRQFAAGFDWEVFEEFLNACLIGPQHQHEEYMHHLSARETDYPLRGLVGLFSNLDKSIQASDQPAQQVRITLNDPALRAKLQQLCSAYRAQVQLAGLGRLGLPTSDAPAPSPVPLPDSLRTNPPSHYYSPYAGPPEFFPRRR